MTHVFLRAAAVLTETPAPERAAPAPDLAAMEAAHEGILKTIRDADLIRPDSVTADSEHVILPWDRIGRYDIKGNRLTDNYSSPPTMNIAVLPIIDRGATSSDQELIPIDFNGQEVRVNPLEAYANATLAAVITPDGLAAGSRAPRHHGTGGGRLHGHYVDAAAAMISYHEIDYAEILPRYGESVFAPLIARKAQEPQK